MVSTWIISCNHSSSSYEEGALHYRHFTNGKQRHKRFESNSWAHRSYQVVEFSFWIKLAHFRAYAFNPSSHETKFPCIPIKTNRSGGHGGKEIVIISDLFYFFHLSSWELCSCSLWDLRDKISVWCVSVITVEAQLHKVRLVGWGWADTSLSVWLVDLVLFGRLPF